MEQVPNWPGPQKPEGNRRDGLRGEERSDGAEGTANVGRALTVDVNGSVRCYDENACLLPANVARFFVPEGEFSGGCSFDVDETPGGAAEDAQLNALW